MDNRRVWEIDYIRTIAIILMVIFHFIYDLNEFLGFNISYRNGFWYWVGRVSAFLFIFLAGLSSGYSKNTVKRGIQVLSFGMFITVVTYFIFREEYIQFGILHFLGTGMIMSPLLNKLNNAFLFIIAVIIAIGGIFINNIVTNNIYLIPLGIRYMGFASLDYYPLIPYLSVLILGILTYKIYYYKKQSLFKYSIENKNIKIISKNSLVIYLIHQPILVLMIIIAKYFYN